MLAESINCAYIRCPFRLCSSAALSAPYQQPVALSPVRLGRTAMCARNKRNTNTDFIVDQNSAGRKKKRNLIISSGAVAALATLTIPTISHAIDLAAISGGAGALAASTNSYMAGLGETGFYQAFSLVFLSEIGDKTFFIAGLLAMKTSRFLSFVGSVGALAVMTVISVVIGQVFHAVPSGITEGIPLDDIAAVLAFAFFGFKTLKEALDMEEGASVMDEELAEAEEAVEGSSSVKDLSAV